MCDANIDFLYLSEQDMIKAGVTDMSGCIDTMEELFKLMSVGNYRMGGDNGNSHGVMMTFPDSSPFPTMPLNGPDRRFMAMPAYVGGSIDMAGVKWYGSNAKNKEKGLPRSILMLTLNDKDTGAPVAYMSANVESAYRTGAVPGVGVRHLARKDATTVGIIGPGVMSRTALVAFTCCCPKLDTLKIKGRGKRSLDAYIAFVKEKFPQFKKIEVVDTIEDAVRGADLVCCATSGPRGSKNYPYFKEEWIKKGAVLCLPAYSRFDDEFLLSDRCRKIVDSHMLYEAWESEFPHPAYETIGIIGVKYQDLIAEGKLPKEAVADMAEILTGKAPGRQSDDDIFIYSVGGMPVEDVAWGTKVYRNALKLGIGTKLHLWDSPELA